MTVQHRPTVIQLFPSLAAVALIYVVTGASLATVPLYVHTELGFGPEVVGAVAGAQFVVALLFRVIAGRHVDRRGPKSTLLLGLVVTVFSGVAFLVSVESALHPYPALVFLFVGRALLGGAESFVITASQTWGLAVFGNHRAAEVIGWVGTVLYLALAFGGPAGGFLYGQVGFGGIALATLIMPLLTFAIICRQPEVSLATQDTGSKQSVLRAIALPGLVTSFAGFGYGSMAFFSVLLFHYRGWEPSWAPFTVFALALVLVRLTCASLTDRVGSIRTSIPFLGLQVAGLTLIMMADNMWICLVASLIAGTGYALIYPAMGREAVRAAPAARSGAAVAYFSACFDLAMGISGPTLGLIADRAGIPAVFGAAAIASALALAILVFVAATRQHDNRDAI